MIITRRSFTKMAGLGADATAMPIWLGADPDADSQKLKIALIGAGGRGKAHVKGLESQHFVAFCDVTKNALQKPTRRIQRCLVLKTIV